MSKGILNQTRVLYSTIVKVSLCKLAIFNWWSSIYTLRFGTSTGFILTPSWGMNRSRYLKSLMVLCVSQWQYLTRSKSMTKKLVLCAVSWLSNACWKKNGIFTSNFEIGVPVIWKTWIILWKRYTLSYRSRSVTKIKRFNRWSHQKNSKRVRCLIGHSLAKATPPVLFSVALF